MTNLKRDYYRTLNIRPIDNETEIKRSYKELAKKFHPDLNPTMRTWAEDKMKELTEAYETLTDSEKRKEYDANPLFQYKVPKFIDPVTKSVRSGPYFLEEKKPGFFDKIKKLMFVETETPIKDKMTKKTAEHFAIGMSYLDKKKDKMLEMAKLEFELVYNEAPDCPEILYNLGILQYLLGDFKEAVNYFSKAKHRMKNNADAAKMVDMLRED